MPLISYVKPTTNKWYSYPRVMVIQINIHATWENPINTTHMLHTPVYVCVAYGSCGQSRTWQPLTIHRQIWMDPTAPVKKGSRHNL
jgi:hypothetical protein